MFKYKKSSNTRQNVCVDVVIIVVVSTITKHCLILLLSNVFTICCHDQFSITKHNILLLSTLYTICGQRGVIETQRVRSVGRCTHEKRPEIEILVKHFKTRTNCLDGSASRYLILIHKSRLYASRKGVLRGQEVQVGADRGP